MSSVIFSAVYFYGLIYSWFSFTILRSKVIPEIYLTKQGYSILFNSALCKKKFSFYLNSLCIYRRFTRTFNFSSHPRYHQYCYQLYFLRIFIFIKWYLSLQTKEIVNTIDPFPYSKQFASRHAVPQVNYVLITGKQNRKPLKFY